MDAHNDRQRLCSRPFLGTILMVCVLLGGCHQSRSGFAAQRPPAEGEIAATQSLQFDIAVQRQRPILITATQHRFDLAMSLQDPDGRVVGNVDSPTKRAGVERLFHVPKRDGIYKVVLTGREHPQASGRYRIDFWSVPADLPAALEQGYRQLSAAGNSFALGSSESRSAAGAFYEEAASSFGRRTTVNWRPKPDMGWRRSPTITSSTGRWP